MTTPQMKGQIEDEVTLKKLATDFASKVPEQEFSAAEILSFLLQYRNSPRIAMENVQMD
jgi:chaperone BCS1